jgi:Rps23 Pro-64 3,4-dihydroxylase Tpa1-like proline 4-hydroxylase
MTSDFLLAEPFPHLVIDHFLPSSLALAAGTEFERVCPNNWHSYDGPDERGKRACNHKSIAADAPTCHALLNWLASPAAAAVASHMTGMEGLRGDPEFYGGGLHATAPGGRLGIHLDNECHPNTRFQRRLNLIIYVTPGWLDEWGGHLEFWDRVRSRAVRRIAPLFNRAVLFETGPWSYHGHPTPLECPPNVERRSLAVYYWSAPRERARFVSTALEAPSAELETARRARSRRNDDQ